MFDAFEQGLHSLGLQSADNGIPVIWSALWNGRMFPNRDIYFSARKQNRPIIILEVGSLRRGITWKVSINHVNRLGIFGNSDNLDINRNAILNIPFKNSSNRRKEILIACQNVKSLQWQGQPDVAQWVKSTVSQIRQYTDKPIVVRPHPRSPFILSLPDVRLDVVKRIPNSYDEFNIQYDYHCVVNFNSGPAVQAALIGTPVICDSSSLAYPVSDIMANVDSPTLPNREKWFLELLHTEWTVEEIAQGIPQRRLLPELEQLVC